MPKLSVTQAVLLPPTSRSSAAIRTSYPSNASADAVSWSSEPASAFSIQIRIRFARQVVVAAVSGHEPLPQKARPRQAARSVQSEGRTPIRRLIFHASNPSARARSRIKSAAP